MDSVRLGESCSGSQSSSGRWWQLCKIWQKQTTRGENEVLHVRGWGICDASLDWVEDNYLAMYQKFNLLKRIMLSFVSRAAAMMTVPHIERDCGEWKSTLCIVYGRSKGMIYRYKEMYGEEFNSQKIIAAVKQVGLASNFDLHLFSG